MKCKQMETATVSSKKIRHFFSHGQTKMKKVYHIKKDNIQIEISKLSKPPQDNLVQGWSPELSQLI